MAKPFSYETGLEINRKRIQSLMRAIAITAIYTKPNTSRTNKQNRIYPYLLTGFTITKPNVVWSTEITYIRYISIFSVRLLHIPMRGAASLH